ncbi:retron Se72 family effector protein [Plesiomonas shigelloides]|uniref:retron Se72 family effector protein n=1 Tax=Plesiomonas shigelloides TaxID=703 RepID=UPI0012619EE8|nr:retron Se72 family effector protein [Plesiomonas shigelloides]KAB7663875.1 cold shock domain-containing protein [Plesiomonas shigelloides]
MDNKLNDEGVINSYDSFKGMGFIRRVKGRDVFFILGDIECDPTDIAVGLHVKFEYMQTKKGPRATKINFNC